MKKLPVTLKTPARAVIVVGLIALVSGFLIMLLIEIIHNALLKDVAQGKMIFEFKE